MRITQILKLLLLSGFLSGCWLTHIKDEAPGSHGNIDLLQSFVGQKSENVVRELGLPNELLSDGDKQFMVYSVRSPDTTFLMIIWIPVWAGTNKENTLHCLRFELDSDNFVKEYRLESRVMKTLVLVVDVDVELTSSCKEVFWSKKERAKLQKATGFPSTWIKLDADFQLTQFKEIRSQDTNQALGWLCMSADLGNQEARYILATIYEYGGYIWIKKGVVHQNYKLAYVWYALSMGELYDPKDLQFFADRHLTAAELSDANNLLREWRPGQCEKDLGLVSHTESKY
jgi:hypothetical protein